jgi:hypothetical protein
MILALFIAVQCHVFTLKVVQKQVTIHSGYNSIETFNSVTMYEILQNLTNLSAFSSNEFYKSWHL